MCHQQKLKETSFKKKPFASLCIWLRLKKNVQFGFKNCNLILGSNTIRHFKRFNTCTPIIRFMKESFEAGSKPAQQNQRCRHFLFNQFFFPVKTWRLHLLFDVVLQSLPRSCAPPYFLLEELYYYYFFLTLSLGSRRHQNELVDR